MGHLEELTSRYPILEVVKGDVLIAYEMLWDRCAGSGRVIIAGNGGSCADGEHIVGELMRGFVKRHPVSGELTIALKKADERRGEELTFRLQGGLSVIALIGHTGLSTAFLNNVNEEMIYAQQLYGYGKKDDVLMGISISGNAENVVYAVTVVKVSNTKTIGLTGKSGGEMVGACDCSAVVPSGETFKIQELHLPVYHALCLMLEEHFYEV